jgi:hypothetical protein
VFACAGETGPPYTRLILSQTSAGKLDYVVGGSSFLRCSFVRAWRPFLRPGLRVQARRAQGAVGRAVLPEKRRIDLLSATGARPASDGRAVSPQSIDGR